MTTSIPEPRVTAGKPGSRSLSKQERKGRILTAARHLFAERGYDRTTLRQIAASANVTVGAIFKHVTDKRDLVHLIFNEDLEEVTTKALAATRPYHTFAQKILSITEQFYRHFSVDPLLSRVLLTEILVETPGLHLRQNLEIRARLLRGIRELVDEAKLSGEIRASESTETIALHIFFVHAAALRLWLGSSPNPEWRRGQRQYEVFLNLQLAGLSPQPREIADRDHSLK